MYRNNLIVKLKYSAVYYLTHKYYDMSSMISFSDYNVLYDKQHTAQTFEASFVITLLYVVFVVYFLICERLPLGFQLTLAVTPLFIYIKYDQLLTKKTILIKQFAKEINEHRTNYIKLIKKYDSLIEEIMIIDEGNHNQLLDHDMPQ